MQVPILETERLILRSWRVEDAPAMFAYAQDPEVGPNAGWKPHESVEESRQKLEQWTAEGQKDWLWAITVKGEGVPVGSLGLHEDETRPGIPDCRMLGYVLARPQWGKGYMTEAAQVVLDYAFTQARLKLVSVNHYPENQRSRRVVEKLGFTLEGKMRRYGLTQLGQVMDEWVYSMTPAEYWLLRAKRQGLSLTLPEELRPEEILAYQAEWDEDDMTPWSAGRHGKSFEDWLAGDILFRTTAKPGYVTGHTYFLVGEDGALLGALNLRHELNEHLLAVGGHIGYGIRPGQRGKRLAPCMLALGLEKAKDRGIRRVLVTCDESNPASARTIEACGGAYENSFREEDGNAVRRYWISL